MSVQPLISIIIPTFNRAHLIGETLDSVLAQTYTNWECLVVDDGSTDGTEMLVSSYIDKDVRFKYHKRPDTHLPGGNGARNYGFKLSKGEFIQWFDSDDLMAERLLDLQLDSILNSSVQISLCQVRFFQKKIANSFILKELPPLTLFTLKNYVVEHMPWLTCSALWNRGFLDSMTELFDEELKAAQEWEFICRVISRQPKIIVLDVSLVFIRKHTNSITYKNNPKRAWCYFEARLRIYQNETVFLDESTELYLRCYLIKQFKNFVLTKNFTTATNVYFKFIIKNSKLSSSSKINAFIFLFTMRVFNKGYKFSNKIICQ